MNPQVIGVIGPGHPKLSHAGVALHPFLIHLVDIEGRIGHHKVELVIGPVDIFVIGIALANISRKAMHRQVHAAEAAGLGNFLLTVDADFAAGVLLVALHKRGRLHKHTPRPTGRVIDAPVVGFDDFHNQLHNRGGGKELTPLLPL